MHGHVKTQGVIAEATHQKDVGKVKELREESRKKAEKEHWENDDLSKQTAVRSVNEFILGLIEHKNAVDNGDIERIDDVDLTQDELVVVYQLSDTIADEIVSEMGDHLRHGGPRGTIKQKADHFFCVALAAVCQAYATMDDFLDAEIEELASEIVEFIEPSAKAEARHRAEPSPRTIETPKARRRKDSFTFLPGEKDFFRRVVIKLLKALKKTATKPIEEGVMLHLRVIAAITCPDPDRHPSIIKYCIWPLLKGPLKKLISDETAGEIAKWIERTYPEENLS